MATLTTLRAELLAHGLEDQVTFASLNVFGRTLECRGGGREPRVMMSLGKHVRGGIVARGGGEDPGSGLALSEEGGRWCAPRLSDGS